MIAYLQNGHAVEVALGIVKEIDGSTIIFSVGQEEISVDVSNHTLTVINEMLEISPFLMLPIHAETNSVLLDINVQETNSDEIRGSTDVLEDI